MATHASVLAVVLFALAAATSSEPVRAQTRTCSASDFQSCSSCLQLEPAIDLKQPNAGEYYRGAEWNGLFAAYVLNCPLVAARLLRAGANPSSGGTSGSMIFTVSSKWPHNNKKTNEAWAALLFAAGASINQRLNWREGKSTADLLAIEQSFSPDYFELFALFQR